MNQNILLYLVAVPALTGSVLTLLLIAGPAQAAVASVSELASCNAPVQPEMDLSATSPAAQGNGAIAVISAATPAATPVATSAGAGIDETPLMDFTAAESDAAVALFGCDCPACINSLRQLRSQNFEQILLSSNPGHCWDAMLQRVSPQEAQEVLQQLEEEEGMKDVGIKDEG